MKIFFEPMPGYTESYEVKYWDRSEEFAKQKTALLYTAGKGRHSQVAEMAARTYRVKMEDIISVRYQ